MSHLGQSSPHALPSACSRLPRTQSAVAVFNENAGDKERHSPRHQPPVTDGEKSGANNRHQTATSTADEKLALDDAVPPLSAAVASMTTIPSASTTGPSRSAETAWPCDGGISTSPSVGGGDGTFATAAALVDLAHSSSRELHPLSDRRRRSSIILNRRMPPVRKTDSSGGELGDRTASKVTLDEELYDILHAFLEAERGEEEEAGGTGEGKQPLTRQHLLDKIREKKEVINKLRCQAWNMNRKRRTLRLAQKYLEQNESKVSKTHLYKEELVKRWRWFLRWLSNIGIYFVPWESRIKRIESQFGSVVSSYFTFLRWVIFINFIITAIIVALVVVPECVADATADIGRQNRTASRKRIPPEEQSHVDEWAVVWHFDGYLRVSPLFYGFYSNDPYISEAFKYPLPLAYFLAAIFVFCFSLFIILRRISLNARLSKLSGTKAEQYVFNWKLFTGWDYSIGNAETATNTAMAAVIKLREAINECQIHAQRRCKPSLWAIRLATNTVIIAMILLSIYCIHTAVQSSETVEKSSGSIFTKNQVPLLLSTITHIFPMIFDLIGRIEKHHAKLSLRLHLIRISSLYVINYATLIYSLFEKLDNIRDISRTMDDTGSSVPPPPAGAPVAPLLALFADANNEDGTGRVVRQRHQWRRQQKPTEGRRPSVSSPQQRPFHSRNFSTPRQLRKFFATTVATPIGANMTRANANNDSNDYDDDDDDGIQKRLEQQQQRHRKNAVRGGSVVDKNGQVTVDGSAFTVHAQFGPVGVNNPTALVRNSTLPTTMPVTGAVPTADERALSSVPPSDGSGSAARHHTASQSSYETRRIGPTPLPTFMSPPRPPTPHLPTFTGLNYGPDWAEIERERERARARKLPPNITVERVADGLPMSWPTQTTTVSEYSGRTFAPSLTHRSRQPARPQAMPPTTAPERPYFLQTTVRPSWSSTPSAAPPPTVTTPPTTAAAASTKMTSVTDANVGEEEEEALYDDHICWETMIGQEIVKLVTMDLYITIISIFIIDFVRGLWIRYCSAWWCWDIETTFPEYGEFKVAENVLHICNNQGMVWLGLFFAPLLPAINNIKLVIIMYIRGWACITCNVPAREIFRASRSSNFFLAILLSALLLCTVPVGYVITSKRPSVLCGPFAERKRFYDVLTELIIGNVPKKALRWLKYVASPGVIIPIILLLILFIVFLISLVRGLRVANTDLQKQLIHERTEEKRKIFELAGGGSRSKMKASTKAQKQTAPGGPTAGGGRKLEPGQYLPEVERKRREPWRLFANLGNKNRKANDVSSLCPSDEPPSSTLPSPDMEEPPAAPQPFGGAIAPPSADGFPAKRMPGAKLPLSPPLAMPCAVPHTEFSPRSLQPLDTQREGLHETTRSKESSTPDELRQRRAGGMGGRELVVPFRHSPPLALLPSTTIMALSPSAMGTNTKAAGSLPAFPRVSDDWSQPANDTGIASNNNSIDNNNNNNNNKNEEKSLYEELNSPKFIDDSARTEEGDDDDDNGTKSGGDKIKAVQKKTARLAQKQSAAAVAAVMAVSTADDAQLGSGSRSSPRPRLTWRPPSAFQQKRDNPKIMSQLDKSLAPLSRPLIHSPRLISTHLSSSSQHQHAMQPFPSASMMTRSADASVISGIPSVEASHRISLYSREPRRIGLPPPWATPARKSTSPTASCATTSVSGSVRPTAALLQRQPSLPSTANTKMLHKTTPPNTMDQFVPWPAPNEIRRQLRPTSFGRAARVGVPPSAAGEAGTAAARWPSNISRGRSPPKMIKSIHPTELSSGPAAAPVEPCRFRITVSPTRRLEQERQQSATAGGTNAPYQSPRRLLINQQVITGSTSTVGTASNVPGGGTERTSGAAALSTPRRGAAAAPSVAGQNRNQQRHQQQQRGMQTMATPAPRAVFGDDDSPQVEQKQSPAGGGVR